MADSVLTPSRLRVLRKATSWFVLAAASLLAVAPATAFAQSQSINGTIRGTVTDASGAAIPAAQITVKNLDTGFTRQVTSGGDGVYVAANLTLGTYSVSTQMTGFAALTQTGIQITAGQDATVNVQLHSGAVATEVVVTADAPIIEPGRFDMGRTISADETENLPLTSRNPYNFILFQPGVSGHPNTENGVPNALNTNGLEDRVNYQLDGEVDTETDQYGLRLFAISDSYVSQVETISNSYPPEFGNTAGIIYNVITGSGTNHLRGEVQYIWRPKAAQPCPILSICDPTVTNGIVKPSIHVDDIMGKIGAPIIHDKLFVFGAYEHLKRSTPAPIAPLSQQTLIAVGDPASDIETAPQVQRAQWADVRVDYDINQKNQAFIRYTYFHNNYPYNTNAGGTNALSAGADFLDHLYDIGAQLLTTFTPRVLNEFRASWPYRNEHHFADPVHTGPGPNITISASGGLGAAGFGGTTGADAKFQEKIPSFSDNTTVIRGAHTLKFGVGFQKNNDTQLSNVYQTFSFSSVTAYLNTKNGLTPQGYTTDTDVVGQPGAAYHSMFFDFFGQDTWQMRKNLLVIYGARYDQYRAPVTPANEPFFLTQRFNTPLGNVAPRVGFAYSPTATTVIRINAGMFYEATPTNTWYNPLNSNGAYGTGSYTSSAAGNTACSPDFPNPPSVLPAGCPTPSAPTQNIYAVTQHFKNGYTWNGNIQVVQAFGKNDSLTISYVMSNGRNMQFLRNLNLLNVTPLSYLADGRPVFSSTASASTRQYYLLSNGTTVNNITYIDVGSNSSYNGVTWTYTHRLSAGLTNSTSYTWSHTIADTPDGDSYQGDAVVEDPTDPYRDRSNSTINRPNAFTSSTVYDPKAHFENRVVNALVNGNTIALLANILSGDPASITTSTHLNGDTLSTSRPLFVTRNSFVSAPVYQFDARYTRTFATIRERYNTQLLVEATNILNHSNFTSDSTTATTNSAGVITAPPSFAHTGGLETRILEFGLKVDF